MSLNIPLYLETRRKFLANRATFPMAELAKYVGQWVAWSPDGTYIIASAPSPEYLDELVASSGADPMACVVEGIPDDDGMVGETGGSEA